MEEYDNERQLHHKLKKRRKKHLKTKNKKRKNKKGISDYVDKKTMNYLLRRIGDVVQKSLTRKN